MPPINPTFNPAQVMLNTGSTGGPPVSTRGPYTTGNQKPPAPAPGGPANRGRTPYQMRGPGGTLPWLGSTAPQAPQPTSPSAGGTVRATGTGPYDATYRQNLATYAGGLFGRPSGNLSFNPTDPNSLSGNPTGGGSAPVGGMPTSLLAQALGQSALPQGSYTQPSPSQSATSNTAPLSNPNIQNWLQNFMQRYMYQGATQ